MSQNSTWGCVYLKQNSQDQHIWVNEEANTLKGEKKKKKRKEGRFPR